MNSESRETRARDSGRHFVPSARFASDTSGACRIAFPPKLVKNVSVSSANSNSLISLSPTLTHHANRLARGWLVHDQENLASWATRRVRRQIVTRREKAPLVWMWAGKLAS